MHGIYDRSLVQRFTLIFLHLLILLFSAWLLFGGGLSRLSDLLNLNWAYAVNNRKILLLSAAAIYFLRFIYTGLVLLKRKMGWSEVWSVAPWLFVIHITFVWLGGINPDHVGIYEYIGIFFYVFGSYLNTGSEYLRLVWKKNPDNKGKLYTTGFFRYSMHINYFGDSMLFTGYAFLTGNIYSLIIPIIMTAGFIFFQIPMLDKYLVEKYGDGFKEYAAKTKKFVPFIW